MLVLTRKNNQSIQINDDIEITILAVDGEQVKIGIDAPKSVDIYRKEIYLDIKKQNGEAAETSIDLFDLLTKNND